MASLLAQTLGFIGPKIGSAAASWVFQKSVNSLFESDNALIRNDIRALSTKVEQIQTSVNNLVKQIDAMKIVLRSDTLNEKLTIINSHYDTILLIFQAVLDIENSPKEKQQAQLNDSQKRLRQKLKDCVHDLPEALKGIHVFLGESGENNIVVDVRNKVLADSRDFVVYYSRMKLWMQRLWLVEAKALYLLRMAHQTAGVNYFEGLHFIETYTKPTGILKEQATHFENTVGHHVISLFDALAKNNGSVAVQFRNHALSPITRRAEGDPINNVWRPALPFPDGVNLAFSLDKHSFTAWDPSALTPYQFTITAKDAAQGRSYYMSHWYGEILGFGIRCYLPESIGGSAGSWYVKPGPNGGDYFNLEYVPGPNNFGARASYFLRHSEVYLDLDNALEPADVRYRWHLDVQS
ncbi:hypothetical protein EJ05DRAFT_502027 [Pseudovirgaria hyperparasitica]|uniref:Uncharacterized protein n=1 Tax=Pseudovirgaria hyperparasitica TaxID=470096 RepID=A0A6A6W633_9PEZI|nr:uncharacterized protein EJ05DRAFT_502027 [Pseudovirgaria hyperparasitica]KAF2756521.1 hypothetical protein EJ05DRAFT_502027 [Pseudovirgaria hyperparasitica]